MILENFSLTKKKFTSSASRNITYFLSDNIISNKMKKLTFFKKSNAGRGATGKRIIRTRTAFLIKKKIIKINYSLRYLRMGTIASFSFIPFKNKLVTLVFFNNGFASYFLSTDLHILFSFFSTQLPKKLKKFKIKPVYLMLFQIKKLSYISLLELIPGNPSRYVRSPGTKARLISFDKDKHTCLIKLPSGIKKIFSYYSYAFITPLSIPFHKKSLNGKAGFWRLHGKKPMVRGVAMNPVDHPHGGRTKSIKYPRTPWGKTTKYK